jgi:hypothetical protein
MLSVGRCTVDTSPCNEELWAIAQDGSVYRLAFFISCDPPSRSTDQQSTCPADECNVAPAWASYIHRACFPMVQELVQQRQASLISFWLHIPAPLRVSSGSASMRMVYSLTADLEQRQQLLSPTLPGNRLATPSCLLQPKKHAVMTCIAVASTDHIWSVDSDGNLYRYEYRRIVGPSFSRRESAISSPIRSRRIIAAVPSSCAWKNAATMGRWVRVRGKRFAQVSVGSDGEVWAVTLAGCLYRRLKTSADVMDSDSQFSDTSSCGVYRACSSVSRTNAMITRQHSTSSSTSANASATDTIDTSDAILEDGEEWDSEFDWKEYSVVNDHVSATMQSTTHATTSTNKHTQAHQHASAAASTRTALSSSLVTARNSTPPALEERVFISKVLVVSKDQIWCVDSHGRLYLRYDYVQFRPVIDSDASVALSTAAVAATNASALSQARSVTTSHSEPALTSITPALEQQHTAAPSASASVLQTASWLEDSRESTITRKVIPPVLVKYIASQSFESKYSNGIMVSSIGASDDGVLWASSVCGAYTLILQPQYLSILTATSYSKVLNVAITQLDSLTH